VLPTNTEPDFVQESQKFLPEWFDFTSSGIGCGDGNSERSVHTGGIPTSLRRFDEYSPCSTAVRSMFES
jgi:hypothetical protein